MNKEELERAIQTIGMGCFVKYFEAFSNLNIPDKDLINSLMVIEGYEESGSRVRVSRAHSIFREKSDKEALILISKSTRAKSWVISKAQFLLTNVT